MSLSDLLPRFRRDLRGVTSTVGYVLILGIVVLSAAGLVGVGAETIMQTQDAANDGSVDQAMTQFDSQMSLVAFEGGSQQQVDLSAGSNEQVTIEEQGQITVELQERGENSTEYNTTDVLLNRSIHSLVYDTEHREVVYQSGGVWTSENDDPETAEMVSPPEFTYEGKTATLPIVRVQENDEFISDDGEIVIEQGDDPEPIFPLSTNSNATNPVSENQTVVLTIQNKYYQAWGDYFETRVGADPIYHHDENRVQITLIPESDGPTIDTPVYNVAGNQRMFLRGQGTSTIVDSYNSSQGPYSATSSDQGSIYSNNGIRIQNGLIEGDVITEGDLILRGNSEITGDAYVEGNIRARGGGGGGGGPPGGGGGGGPPGGGGGGGPPGGSAASGPTQIHGATYDNASVADVQPVDPVIGQIHDELKDDNDNDEVSAITDQRRLDASSNPHIDSGEYYLSNFNVQNGETVTFDVSDGDVEVLVDGSINVNNANIEVVGNDPSNDNRVQIFTRSKTIHVGTDITTEHDEAKALWFYGPAGTYATIQSGSQFTGVIYAPGTPESPGRVTLKSHGEVYGATVGGDIIIENQAVYHYDSNLRRTSPFTEPRHTQEVSAVISYFHISETDISIEES